MDFHRIKAKSIQYIIKSMDLFRKEYAIIDYSVKFGFNMKK